MKQLTFSLLALTALGASSIPAYADPAAPSTAVTGDTATIQEVEMYSDQMGNGNYSQMSGTLRNHTSGNTEGSTGTVQRGHSSVVQTGTGNDSRMEYTIENRTNRGAQVRTRRGAAE